MSVQSFYQFADKGREVFVKKSFRLFHVEVALKNTIEKGGVPVVVG